MLTSALGLKELDPPLYLKVAVRLQRGADVDVFAEIANKIPESAVVISMAAGVKIEKLQAWAPQARFIRMMPNVPAQIGQGMTAISYGSNIKE